MIDRGGAEAAVLGAGARLRSTEIAAISVPLTNPGKKIRRVAFARRW